MTVPAAAVPASVSEDDWGRLREHTAARIALGRSGTGLPTRAHLAFGLAHAQARDAVRAALDRPALCGALAGLGLDIETVTSRAGDRAAYLARPDWGRRLAEADAERLAAQRGTPPAELAIVLGDGLSATAVHRQAPALLAALLPRLAGWRVAPLVIATQARVALADEIGERLGAALALILIGERPGLSSPDSLGAYLTWNPRIGRHDAERNCISNIRPEGLPPAVAAARIAALLAAARAARISGVRLAFDPGAALPAPG